VPAEAVYAVFEAKQSIGAEAVRYAQRKVASVRKLNRTSLPIPHAGGTYPPKPLPHIFGGLLTLDSNWTPALGQSLSDALFEGDIDGRLDLGCVAAHGMFRWCVGEHYVIETTTKPAAAFLFELIAMLQTSATAPMIDVRAYSRWLPR